MSLLLLFSRGGSGAAAPAVIAAPEATATPGFDRLSRDWLKRHNKKKQDAEDLEAEHQSARIVAELVASETAIATASRETELSTQRRARKRAIAQQRAFENDEDDITAILLLM